MNWRRQVLLKWKICRYRDMAERRKYAPLPSRCCWQFDRRALPVLDRSRAISQPNIPVPIETLKDASQLETWFHENGMLAFSLREPQTGGKVIDVLVHPIVSYGQLARNAFIAESVF